jgi:hypothetical protein
MDIINYYYYSVGYGEEKVELTMFTLFAGVLASPPLGYPGSRKCRYSRAYNTTI